MAVVAGVRRAVYASALSASTLVCGQFHVSQLGSSRFCSERPYIFITCNKHESTANH